MSIILVIRKYLLTTIDNLQSFPFVGQCYNAISFVIGAWDGYQSAFDRFAELLEKCSAHLGRPEYYVQGEIGI